MEIFGIGPMELLLVFILALIFIGPGKMPEVAASLGKMLREFRAASAELTDALNAEIADVERRKNVAAAVAGENGHSQAAIGPAEAEVVAQAEVDAPSAVEYTPAETPIYQYESSGPAPAPTYSIEDVLAAIARQELDAAAAREAEEAARLAAIAAERAIRDGVGPLPEALLMPSTDAPLVVVNPTEHLDHTEQLDPAGQDDPDPMVESAVEAVEAPFEALPPVPGSEPDGAIEPAGGSQSPLSNGVHSSADSSVEGEPLEASTAGQAEVL